MHYTFTEFIKFDYIIYFIMLHYINTISLSASLHLSFKCDLLAKKREKYKVKD